MRRAVALIPTDDPAHTRWMVVCGEYCSRNGFLITAIARNYLDAVSMLACRGADIIVAARRDHIPPDLVHVVSEQQDGPTDDLECRRPIRMSAGRPPRP